MSMANAVTQDRTGDLQIFSLTLSQLSYRGHGGSDERDCRVRDTQNRQCFLMLFAGHVHLASSRETLLVIVSLLFVDLSSGT